MLSAWWLLASYYRFHYYDVWCFGFNNVNFPFSLEWKAIHINVPAEGMLYGQSHQDNNHLRCLQKLIVDRSDVCMLPRKYIYTIILYYNF